MQGLWETFVDIYFIHQVKYRFYFTFFSQVVPALDIINSFNWFWCCIEILLVIFFNNTFSVSSTERFFRLILCISCQPESSHFSERPCFPSPRTRQKQHSGRRACSGLLPSGPPQLTEQEIRVPMSLFMCAHRSLHTSLRDHLIPTVN